MQYSLQHQTLLPSPVISTTGCCFSSGSLSSFFLELFLHWSPVAYWTPTDLQSSSFSVLSFCLFILFMGFSRQEYWSGLPFPSPVDHVSSELSTMSCLSWVVLHSIAHSFIELDKAVVHVSDWLVFFDCVFHSVCPPMEKNRRLMEASWWERLTEEKTGSCSDGWGHPSKSLMQFSVDGWGCVPSLLFDLRPNYGGGNQDNCDLLQKVQNVSCTHCCTQCSQPWSSPLLTHWLCWGLLHTHRQVWVSLLWSQCSFLLGPDAQKLLFVPSKSLFPQSCVSSGGSLVGLMQYTWLWHKFS